MLRKLLLRWIEKLESEKDDTDIEEIVKGFNGLSNHEGKGTNSRIAEARSGKGCYNV